MANDYTWTYYNASSIHLTGDHQSKVYNSNISKLHEIIPSSTKKLTIDDLNAKVIDLESRINGLLAKVTEVQKQDADNKEIIEYLKFVITEEFNRGK